MRRGRQCKRETTPCPASTPSETPERGRIVTADPQDETRRHNLKQSRSDPPRRQVPPQRAAWVAAI